MMFKTGHAEAAPSQVSVAGKLERPVVFSTGAGYTQTMTLPAKGDVRMMIRAGCELVETEPSDERVGLYFRTVNPTLCALT
jgi:hypothetical protein